MYCNSEGWLYVLIIGIWGPKEINWGKTFTCSCNAVTQTSMSFILMYKMRAFSVWISSSMVWLNQLILYKNYKKEKLINLCNYFSYISGWVLFSPYVLVLCIRHKHLLFVFYDEWVQMSAKCTCFFNFSGAGHKYFCAVRK